MGFFNRKTELSKEFEWLVVGLGNPGKKYVFSRHNIGWMVTTALCEKYNKPIMPFSSIYLQSSLRIEKKLIMVALPTTYMNNSGEAVKAIVDLYEIPQDRIIVIVDEYNFPLGKVHLKSGGGDGGHNGMASVLEHLGLNDFLRLRCGIDKKFGAGELVDYVLSDFSPEENPAKNLMIQHAIESIEAIVTLGKARAMSEINSEKLWQSEKSGTTTKNLSPQSTEKQKIDNENF
jgi:PTH1 family peptidyl-tRNA hydrolase